MKFSLSLFSMAVLALSLTACMHNRSNDYLKAHNNPSLKTPPGINNPNFIDHNPIPEKSTPGTVAAPSLVPPGLAQDQAEAKIALAAAKTKQK